MSNISPTKSQILIVEDEPAFREVLAAALTAHGHSVEVAENGSEAERRLDTHSFDLIITDVLMPEEDGLEMLLNLRAVDNPTPVIAITGNHMYTELYLKTAKALGAKRILRKPFGIRDLLDAMRETLYKTPPTECGLEPDRASA